MPRTSSRLDCSEKDRQCLEQLAASRDSPKQAVDRAQMILGCADGARVKDIARRCHTRPNTIIKWRDRFIQRGLKGLKDAPRPGAKRVYDDAFRSRVLATLQSPPPAGKECWDGPSISAAVKGSVDAVWRLLRREGISLQRRRCWSVKTEKEFVAKTTNIQALYLGLAETALVICVGEEVNPRALERTNGYVETDNGKVFRELKKSYKRDEALDLAAALQVATAEFAKLTIRPKYRDQFLPFMDYIVTDTPTPRTLHVILDSSYRHDHYDSWLAQHPSVHLHTVQGAASWLGQIETWFSILSKESSNELNSHTVMLLHDCIKTFLSAPNPSKRPFKWSVRESGGAQPMNNIAFLYN